MDMSSSTDAAMMTPFLHFFSGDFLIFKAWQPTSGGAIAGACVGLFLFALFERWVGAMSSAFEAQWMQRALRTQTLSPPMLEKPQLSVVSSEESTKKQRSLPLRTIPPFIASIDIPRGMLYGFQRLLGFILMLAVMTFHAGYFISILVGLGLGEILFGRIGVRAVKADH